MPFRQARVFSFFVENIYKGVGIPKLDTMSEVFHGRSDVMRV